MEIVPNIYDSGTNISHVLRFYEILPYYQHELIINEAYNKHIWEYMKTKNKNEFSIFWVQLCKLASSLAR